MVKLLYNKANSSQGNTLSLPVGVWNSALKAELGDCVVLGASSPAQLRDTIEEIGKGALEE
jgi:hypothetical protein